MNIETGPLPAKGAVEETGWEAVSVDTEIIRISNVFKFRAAVFSFLNSTILREKIGRGGTYLFTVCQEHSKA